MTRAGKVLTLFIVVALGIWGCSKGPGGHPAAQTERVKALEAKCAKLEEDYRAAASSRDQARKQAGLLDQERAQWDEQRAQLQKDLDAQKGLVRELQRTLVRERDSYKQQLELRTNERDHMQMRCERLKKGLQSLIGQDDAMIGPSLSPATLASPASSPTSASLSNNPS
jgi:septal ring factor EnvC (AmiA/AmiB activator)